MTNRTILKVSGKDAEPFLQNIVTNDLAGLEDGLVYAALLTPQGKYLADFFLSRAGDAILIDADSAQAPALAQRLTMYKLRADVEIEATDLHLHRGLGDVPTDAASDPRDPALGWRAYRDTPQTDDSTDWDALRIDHLIPEAGVELIPNESFILEMGFERLSGVDFKKGCYVGQEVTARMKHKTELRKGLAQVSVEGEADPGDEITAGTKTAGTLLTRSGNRALAFLRFDRANGPIQAGSATVERD